MSQEVRASPGSRNGIRPVAMSCSRPSTEQFAGSIPSAYVPLAGSTHCQSRGSDDRSVSSMPALGLEASPRGADVLEDALGSPVGHGRCLVPGRQFGSGGIVSRHDLLCIRLEVGLLVP